MILFLYYYCSSSCCSNQLSAQSLIIIKILKKSGIAIFNIEDKKLVLWHIDDLHLTMEMEERI